MSQRNLISGNVYYGVIIAGQGTNGNVVAGNDISTDATYTSRPYEPASYAGIGISDGASDNTIGGAMAVAGNLITNNGGPGVIAGRSSYDYMYSVANQITANRIFANTGQAIDLGDDGVTYNSMSPRQGPKDLQNFPVFATAASGGLEGWLGGSTPDTPFRVDFFASANYGPGGSGEAQDYLGSLEVTTDATGQVTFAVPFTAPAGLPIITATATDPQGNTSEVSALRPATLQSPSLSVRKAANQSLAFATNLGDGIVIQDPDAPPITPLWDLTLSVSDGTLTLSTTAGLTGSGDGTRSLSYSGTLAALNAALQGMIYNPAAGPPGRTTLLTLGARSSGASPLQTQLLITDGVFAVDTTADSGPGSLRQAILDADSEAGLALTIDFAIPGDRLRTIEPVTPLPAITASVLIDGTTQPGFNGAPLIAVGGRSPGSVGPLTVSGGNLTIRGMALSGIAIDATADERPDRRQLRFKRPAGQLSLLDATGRVLVQSDGVSSNGPPDAIDEHLPAGTYFLQVAATGGAEGWALTANLTPASPPFQAIPVGFPQFFNGGYDPLAVGDFTGDGNLDLAAMDGLHLGLGDGTFREPLAGLGPPAANRRPRRCLVTGAFNGDGKLDLAVEYYWWRDHRRATRKR